MLLFNDTITNNYSRLDESKEQRSRAKSDEKRRDGKSGRVQVPDSSGAGILFSSLSCSPRTTFLGFGIRGVGDRVSVSRLSEVRGYPGNDSERYLARAGHLIKTRNETLGAPRTVSSATASHNGVFP